MQPDLTSRSVLVLGGTGAIGAAVLRQLARRGVRAAFTYLTREDRARALARELDHVPRRCDLADLPASRELLASLEPVPDVVIHCAAVSGRQPIEEISAELWERTMSINARSALLAAQHLAAVAGGGDLVVVGALDRTQSLPLPVHFAASQGALSAMVMAVAHELGPRGVRANMITLGPMGGGLSADLASETRADYQRFSALRREGTPEEAARAIVWLALENGYLQGKVVPVNGGI